MIQRIALPESVRIRLAELHQQKAQIDRDIKTTVDTVLGMQFAPDDPAWSAAVELHADHIAITEPA